MMNNSDYFMSLAEAVAQKSKDTSTKVGAVIVDKNNRVVSTGYNGYVAGCNEYYMTQERPMKYNLTIHAEINSILQAKIDLTGCLMFTTHAPCDNCLKHALQAGIRHIYYKNSDLVKRADRICNEAIRLLITSTDAVVVSTTTRMSLDAEIDIHFMNEKLA